MRYFHTEISLCRDLVLHWTATEIRDWATPRDNSIQRMTTGPYHRLRSEEMLARPSIAGRKKALGFFKNFLCTHAGVSRVRAGSVCRLLSGGDQRRDRSAWIWRVGSTLSRAPAAEKISDCRHADAAVQSPPTGRHAAARHTARRRFHRASARSECRRILARPATSIIDEK